MGANKKCDMHSFGVVALEVIMEKYPGDLISFLSSSPPHGHQILLKDVLDQRFSPPMHQGAKKIVFVAKIVFSYLQQNPHVRPSMKQVSEKLSPLVSSFSQVNKISDEYNQYSGENTLLYSSNQKSHLPLTTGFPSNQTI